MNALKLEIWPGYITSIRQHEEDILLCAEISHKVMRAETAYDIMKRIRAEERDSKTKITQALLGTTVLTKYNNKTYRIDEITYDVKPSDTFQMRDEQISYIAYYKVSKKLLRQNVNRFSNFRNSQNQETIQHRHSRSWPTNVDFQR